MTDTTPQAPARIYAHNVGPNPEICPHDAKGAVSYVREDLVGWLDIKSAPKIDGHKILVWSLEFGLCVAEWVCEDLDLIDWDEPGWSITPVGTVDCYDSDPDDLTDWMPLPLPPEAKP